MFPVMSAMRPIVSSPLVTSSARAIVSLNNSDPLVKMIPVASKGNKLLGELDPELGGIAYSIVEFATPLLIKKPEDLACNHVYRRNVHDFGRDFEARVIQLHPDKVLYVPVGIAIANIRVVNLKTIGLLSGNLKV